MSRRPPKYTRTYTRFPYTTLFRSGGHVAPRRHQEDPSGSHGRDCQGNGMSEDSKSPLKVWGWSADKGGCQAYRIRFPLTAIKEYRPEVVIGWGGVIPEAARVAADVIVGQRVCMPGPSKLWQSWAKDGRKLIFEMDDDLWNVDPANERAYYFFRDQDIRRRLVENIRVAYAVTVSTPELAEEVFQQTGHGNIHVIPNAVPAWLLDHEAERNHHVGWGGSPTHHGDFGLRSEEHTSELKSLMRISYAVFCLKKKTKKKNTQYKYI